MRLSVRTASADDLRICFNTMGDSFAYPADIRSRVADVWVEWLHQGALTAHLIEHRTRDLRFERYGLGATVFIDPNWIKTMRARRRPYWRAELIRSWLAGDRFVLMPEQVRSAQRDGGLTVFFVADALANRALTDDKRLAADAQWGKSLFGLQGCRLREIWIEVYGDKSRDWIGGCGLLTKDDWSPHANSELNATTTSETRPHLLSLSHEEALARPGTHGSFLFMHDAPQFAFTARQQELLLRALQGETDEELAGTLGVTTSAVKKRWVAIYDRASQALPSWLEAADGSSTRGTEKRRHLLNHLRDHPAELHPANAARD